MLYLRIFGSSTFVHVPDETRCYLGPKAVECILVGYWEGSKSFHVWTIVTRKIIISRVVVFIEDAVYKGATLSDEADYDSLFPLGEVPVVEKVEHLSSSVVNLYDDE